MNIPLGSFRNSVWSGWRLTTGDRYLILPTSIAERIESYIDTMDYWRFMARQLKRIGLPLHTEGARWRAFTELGLVMNATPEHRSATRPSACGRGELWGKQLIAEISHKPEAHINQPNRRFLESRKMRHVSVS